MSSPFPDDRSQFQSFQARLQNGDSAAARELFDQYSRQLVRLASNNIHPILLKRFDGEDVVQSVFRTFFRRQEEGRLQIEHSQQLWQLLAALTLCKTRSHARKHTAEKRNVAADQQIVDPLLAESGSPSPDEVLVLWEELGVALEGLPERAAEIVSMRLEGRNRSEIARELGLSRQTIHRILKLVQDRIEQRFDHISTPNQINSEKVDESE